MLQVKTSVKIFSPKIHKLANDGLITPLDTIYDEKLLGKKLGVLCNFIARKES